MGLLYWCDYFLFINFLYVEINKVNGIKGELNMSMLSNYSSASLNAVSASVKTKRSMMASLDRLSTGKRTINGNDPGGTAVASNITTQARSASIAARNAEDGISYLHAAEGVLMELATLNTRLRELAVQKQNGLLSIADKAAIESEENEIINAADKIANVEFNDRELLSTFVLAINNAGTLSQMGAVYKPTFQSGVSNVDTQSALIQKSLGQVAAGINALKGHQSNMHSLAANARAAASRIQDTDFAQESASLAQSSILNKSALAMVAQANNAMANILTLLN